MAKVNISLTTNTEMGVQKQKKLQGLISWWLN